MFARVLLAGLFHETHTFLTAKTTLADCNIVRGDEMLELAGNGSPLAGFLEVAHAEGWQVQPTIDLRATPSGMVEDAVFDYFWREFSRRAAVCLREGVDAIFLVLHGAMASESHPDIEGELLARLRQLPGAEELPVFGVLDLHANLSPRMAAHADCLVAYRQNPHTDAHATAVRAAHLLAGCLASGCRPRSMLRRLPIVWAPPGTGTGRDPMASLVRAAIQAEELDSTVWAVSIAAGFSFADTPDTGVSVLVSGTADRNRLEECAERIAHRAWELRELGQVTYPDVDTVLSRILPVTDGPVLLVEPSDNIGGGAPGDGTGILRALLRHDVPDALVVIDDAAAVQHLHAVPPGGTLTLPLGGRGSSLDPGPVTLEVTLVSRTDGNFDLEDIHSHLASMSGRHIAMGDCAVVRHRGITVLLTSRKTPPFDLGQLRSQGIEPTRMKVIGVKAAVAHQRAYDPIARASHFVETPGPCSSRLETFCYRHLTRPVFPLDPLASFDSRL
jgi:microcystin degradation protein MlrC